jgi:hypothetical protein
LFQGEVTETKATTPETVLGSVPGDDGFCSSETRDDTKTKVVVPARRLQDQRPQPRRTVRGSSPDENGFSSSEITGTKVTNPKTVLSVSLGEDVGFRDDNNNNNNNNTFLYDIQRYVSNDQAYD